MVEKNLFFSLLKQLLVSSVLYESAYGILGIYLLYSAVLLAALYKNEAMILLNDILLV